MTIEVVKPGIKAFKEPIDIMCSLCTAELRVSSIDAISVKTYEDDYRGTSYSYSITCPECGNEERLFDRNFNAVELELLNKKGR